jgi:proline iminopeptidase
MLVLYPPIKTYAIHQLAVDNLHTLYIEECGNPQGLPVLFLHGGPGAGCNEDHRRFFDPSHYRIILFDQRGTGRSTPHAELQNNTTQNLVADMEAIRRHLNVERWVLFGGSWGSTLALVYAETHPKRVLSMILRGIFLCRQTDIDWFYSPGYASQIFPDAWEAFVNHLSPSEQNNILASYYQRLTGEDELVRMSAAKAWSLWEGTCSTLQPNPNVVNHFTERHVAMSLARIETHYFMNNSFFESDQIIRNAHHLENIPGILVHGRYDIVCPLDNAYCLNKAWPKSRLEIIRDAGHSAYEPGILHALISATRETAQQFSG